MAWDFSNGLLGMGGFGMGGNNMPANSLLGEFYNPADMRKYQMKQMLLGLGAGLMAEKGIGKGAALALAAGDRAGSQYRDNALDAYRIKSQQEQQAKADERWQKEWDYRVGRDKKADDLAAKTEAWNAYLREQKINEDQRAEDQRNALQNEVTGWMGEQAQQGASLPFSPGVRSIARQGGLAGPSATDQWRYDNAQPYVGAQDFGNAFQQITAQPPKAEGYTLAPGAIRFENGVPVAQGAPKTPDTVINNGGQDDFDKQLAKGVADVYKAQMEQGNNAAATKSAAQQLRVLMQGRGGALDGFAATVSPYLPEGMVPEGTNDLVAAQSVIAGMIPKQRVPGSGTTSDYDAKMFAQSLPSLWNKPGANEVILNTIESYADYQLSISNIIADVAADPSIQNKSQAIRQQIAQLPDPFARWKQAMQSRQSGPADPALNSGPGAPNVRKYNPATGRLE